jgi:hypothetical protein
MKSSHSEINLVLFGKDVENKKFIADCNGGNQADCIEYKNTKFHITSVNTGQPFGMSRLDMGWLGSVQMQKIKKKEIKPDLAIILSVLCGYKSQCLGDYFSIDYSLFHDKLSSVECIEEICKWLTGEIQAHTILLANSFDKDSLFSPLYFPKDVTYQICDFLHQKKPENETLVKQLHAVCSFK